VYAGAQKNVGCAGVTVVIGMIMIRVVCLTCECLACET